MTEQKHPPAEKQWRPSTRRAWADYWQSDVATVVTRSDWSELLRYFGLLDEQERLFAAAKKQPLVPGARGANHLVANPLLAHALGLNFTLRELGDRYGRNPTARIRLLGRQARADSARPANVVPFARPPAVDDIDLEALDGMTGGADDHDR